MHPLVRLVDQLAREGVVDVLVIGDGGIADTAANPLRGVHARVPLPEALEGNLTVASNCEPQFDLCLCTLSADRIARFSEIVDRVVRVARSGGPVIGFYPNFDLPALPAVEASLVAAVLRRAGDRAGPFRRLGNVGKRAAPVSPGVAALRGAAAAAALPAHRPSRSFSLATRTFVAKRREAAVPRAPTPNPCTSLTIEVILSKEPPLKRAIPALSTMIPVTP